MPRQLRFDLGPCLFFGDNLDILPAYIADETVDLVYLDPPFNSKATYNMIFRHIDKTPAAAQVKAFEDTWHWDMGSERAFRVTVERGGGVSKVLLAFREFLGPSDMLAYLAMMAPRLVELHRVMKDTGSIYLHCDPTASHYLKLLMDAIFGSENFRNEVIWRRTPFKGSSKARALQMPRSHDTILFYSKGKHWTWHPPTEPYADKYLKRFKWDDHDGRGPFRKSLLKTYSAETEVRLKAENRWIDPVRTGAMPSYKQYLNESAGTRQIDDVWTDINMLNPVASERMGYPTQKPLALLERIIQASSEEGSVVLDPFCGCGTAVDAAQRLGRRWIGIDITEVAIRVIQKRLERDYSTLDYSVRGIPTTMDEVDFLAERDKYALQQWVCDRLGIDADIRKGADHGIDGELVRYTVAGKPWRAVVSVKGGGVNVTQIRDLRGTVERENADTGIFITRKAPTRPMVDEAVAAGLTEEDIPKIQILTAADLLAGKAPQVPLPTMVAQKPLEAVAKPEGKAVPVHKRVSA